MKLAWDFHQTHISILHYITLCYIKRYCNFIMRERWYKECEKIYEKCNKGYRECERGYKTMWKNVMKNMRNGTKKYKIEYDECEKRY